MNLKTIQARFREIALQLGSVAPLPTTPQQDGSPHAEQIGDKYFHVVTERGKEYERRETNDPDELLSWFVRDLTSAIAGDWELENRIPSQDTRRLRFAKHVELLRGINETWAAQQKAYYDTLLARYPFDDASEDRVDFFVSLQKQGVDEKEAWQQALARFPEPKST